MRSIGKKNFRLVENTVNRIVREWKGKDFSDIEETIIMNLPSELWDIWEGADQEIRGIIDDALMNI